MMDTARFACPLTTTEQTRKFQWLVSHLAGKIC
jgi:hypothetical protein